MYIDQSNQHLKMKLFLESNEQRHVKFFKFKLYFSFAYHSQSIHHPNVILKVEKAHILS